MNALYLNEVTIAGMIDKIGDLTTRHPYTILEIIVNVQSSYKDKDGRWANKDEKVAITFFNKMAEEVYLFKLGDHIIVRGAASTRFRTYNDKEIATTSIQGKKYQRISSANNFKNDKENYIYPINLDNFEDKDIPF